MKMKVLSLFDGISCGMVALERAGIEVDAYYASEIEPNAIKISKKNYPQIIQIGDITKITEEMLDEIMPIDLVIGGSPCQDLSVYKFDRGDAKGLEGTKSSLFYHYERILKYVKPQYFLLENVPMQREWEDVITELLGVEPIKIDSNLLCAADRKRLYWTNIQGIEQPQDKGILLKDIVVPADDVPEKYWYTKPFIYNGDDKKVQCTLQMNGHRHMKEVYNLNGKCNTLTTCAGGNLQKKVYQNGRCRKLTPLEYERLQTLPDGYTEGVADSHRYNAIGNGWTVDVIAHILSYIKEEKEKEMELKVKAPTFPEVIEFNFDELKQEITERASTYVNLVYSEEQIQDAKKDRATLNKFVKALSDERIKIKKECLKPYEDFEAKIKELDKIVSVAISNIDSQVKGYEEKKKQEKLDEITNFFNSTDHPEWLHISQIMNEKWLNASVSMKAAIGEMDSRLEQIESDLVTLANLPEFGFEATEVYKRTLDLGTAISEGQRLADMAKRKAEAERLKAEREAEQARLAAEAEAWEQAEREAQKIHEEEAFQADAMNPPEQLKQWVSFKALLTVDQAKELKRFFDDRCIEFEAI